MKKRIFISLLVCIAYYNVWAQQVTNVVARPIGGVLFVTYDIIGTTGVDYYDVEVWISAHCDGNYTQITNGLQGELMHQAEGKGKAFSWSPTTDVAYTNACVTLRAWYTPPASSVDEGSDPFEGSEPSVQNSVNAAAPQFGTFTDPRDNHVYKSVTIGTQTWLAENLAYKPKRGDYWAYNNDQSNVAKYGYLYDWETANNVCPTGWHLPSDAEWETLAQYINSQKGTFAKSGDVWQGVGDYLKATSGWNNNGKGNDYFGFNGLPGGSRYTDGSLTYAGNYGYWWSSTQNDASNAWYRTLYYYTADFYRSYHNKLYGFSVRCIRD